MRAALVTAGGPKVPDLDKARRYGITRLYWEAIDPQLDADLLAAVSAKGFDVGVMRDPNWDRSTAVDLARKCDADLVRLKRGGAGVQCAVLVDIEYPYHDPVFILAWLREWRDLRPQRDTCWTPEYHQAGWFGSQLVAAINADVNLRVIPQAYVDDPPLPVSPDATRCDVTNAGVHRERTRVFYLPGQVERAAVGLAWDGIVFDFAKLP